MSNASRGDSGVNPESRVQKFTVNVSFIALTNEHCAILISLQNIKPPLDTQR